ncbi:hypothetical protein E4U31_007979 [Claviceps sp. LM219 group G6]|nr:hypothetical protein E4U31_007979 [Claviceps sp. LM219 group G6]
MSTSITPIIYTLSVPLTGLHTSDAGRWLEKIKWAFQLTNDGQDADPSTFTQAINMALERSAVTM